MGTSRVFWRWMRGGVGLALLAISCEPASVGADTEFDQPLILTADAPVTAFEVTYCLNDEPTRSLSVSTRFSVSVRSEDSHVVTLERLTVEEGDDAADAEHSVDEIETKAEESVSGLVVLGDRETRGCAEPEIVQISVQGLSEGQTVTVESAFASVSGDFFTGACDEPLTDESFSIEIVHL